MTWIATDNFDSYSTGQNLDSDNGGSNWSAAWVQVSGGTMTVETAPAGMSGNAVRSLTATANTKYSRLMAGINAGMVTFKMQISITDPNDFVGVVLRDADEVGYMFVRFGPTGNLEIFDNGLGDYQSLGTYSADTTYTIDIEFDDNVQPNNYRARVDGGTFSNWFQVNGGSYTTIERFAFDDSATNAHTVWYDDIGPVLPTPDKYIPGSIFI